MGPGSRSNCVLIDRECYMDRVIRGIVCKRVLGSESLVRTINDHTVHMITGVGCEREYLAPTVRHTYGARRTYRAIRTRCRSDRILIDRKCNMDRMVRGVVRERVLRTGALINPIYDYTVNMVSGVGSESENLNSAIVHIDGSRWAYRAVGACRRCDRILVDCKCNMNRVVRRIVRKRVLG